MTDFRINVIVDPSRAKRGAAQVEKSLDRMTGKANNLGSALRRAIGFLGVGLLARQAIGTLASFSQEMSTVAAVTHATEQEFAALEERAISLGTNTRFTATQAAEGMVVLARAGLDTSEAIDSVGAALMLAQAGALSIAQAAEISTTAIKVFGKDAKDAADVSDVLVLAANSAKTNVTQLGQAFTFAATDAAALGIDLETTAAAAATLAEGGLTATRAGTGLRSVLQSLSAPTREAEKAIKDAGLKMSDVNIESHGLEGALKNIGPAMQDSGFRAAVFGKRFGAAALILQSNLPMIEEMKGKFENLGGEAQRVADEMDDNLNGSILAMKSAFEGLILRLGQNGMQGAFRGLVDTITNGLRAAADNVEQFIRVVEGLAFVLSVNLARRAIPAVIAQVKALGVAIATNPIGAMATVITLAIGYLIAFRKEIKLTGDGVTTMADFMTAAWDGIQDGLQAVSEAFEGAGQAINESLGGAFDGFQLDMQTVLLGLSTFADTAIGIMLALGNSLVELFTGLPKAVGSGILQVLSGINNFIESATDHARAFFNAIGSTARSVGIGLVNFFREIDLALTQIAQGQLSAARETVSGATELLKGQLGGIGSTFASTFEGELKQLKGERLLKPIVNIFEGAGEDMAANMTAGWERGLSFSGLTDFTLNTFQAADAIGAARVAAEGQAAAQEKANEQTAKAIELAAQVPESVEPATQSVASFGDQLSGGLTAGLQAGVAGITDVSGAAETLMVNGFGAAEDALVSFATTGEADIGAMVDGMLEDLARLLARQALFGLISSLGGGGWVGSAANALGGGGGGGDYGGERAGGGPVNPNQAFLVGEEGPELFVPPGAGNIKTAAETAGMVGGAAVQSPPVNVTVVNTSDPSDTISAMGSAQGTQLILNAIQSNPTVIKNSLQ